MSNGPILIGVKGCVSGERFPLLPGVEVFIGRSRSCEICLSKCRGWTKQTAEAQQADDEFNSVSRRHLRVLFRAPDTIELEDMSANGSYVDGRPIKRLDITDLRERVRDVRLGTRESFRLEWQEA